MKNYYSPARGTSNRRLFRLNRVRVVLLLALVAALSCLPFYVFAQDDAASARSKRWAIDTAVTKGTVFVMYQAPNGDTVCRDATLSESLALKADTSAKGLRQINHLESQKAGNGPSASESPNANLTIILRATAQLDGNPEAKAAFIAAAAKWESLIKDPITIIIDVDYGPTFFGTPFSGPNILGATATQQIAFENNYSDVRSRLLSHASSAQETTLYNALPTSSLPTNLGSVDTIFVATPVLRALGAIDPVADPPSEPNFGSVPKIAFNSGFGFDFDPSDGITGNRTDFDAVAVHEIGHALGFDSAVGEQEIAPPGTQLTASLWDIFRVRPGTANLGNFNTVQRILSTDGAQVQFNGGPELALSTGNPLGDNGDGEQASHWKDDAQTGGVFIGIMDPSITRNRREVLQPNDENAVDMFGFTIGTTPPPANDNFADSNHLTGASGTVTGTNAGATKETGEPIQPESPIPPPRTGGRSVWYDWTATGTGQTTIDTNGSNFDTTLAVYTGSVLTSLSLVVANDDISPLGAPPPRNLQSLVTFTATVGTTYRIQVDGFNPTDTGNITLHWSGPAIGPNTVQFTASTASANETANATTHVDLQVTRTGNTLAGATVNYTTSNLTASDRFDYEAAAGTLQFAAGETSRIITVFIVDDAFGEGPETFSVTLSNPVNCTLGSPVTVTVTINSNESADGPNPVKNATFNSDFFVRQHYLDFFNREPDPGGLAFWKNQIDECETRPPAEQQPCREIRRINVSAAFFLSIEFQQTGYLVERLYKVAYGDGVGTSTLNGAHQLAVPIVRLNEFLPDTQQIGRGVVIGDPGADQLLENNKQALIAEFVQRPRFLAKYPVGMTPGAFVNDLIANTGSGLISPDERNQLVSDLTTGAKNRAQVLRAIADDSDLFAAERNRAFVLAQFFGYLRRNPNDAPETGLDYTGYDFWLGKLNQFGGNFVNAEMVKAFIVSGEYQARFGP